jgi:cytosine deaminase
MIPDFTVVPAGERLRLVRATVPAALVGGARLAADAEGLAPVDIDVVGGLVSRIAPSVAPAGGPAAATLDLDGGLVLPCLADIHTHIDKGHIWPRRPNPDGTFMGALLAVRVDREANWTAEDVRRRMEFSLKCAYAHGTNLVRTHIDSIAPQHRVTWPVFAEVREAWAGRIDLQAVCLTPLDETTGDAALAELAGLVAEIGGALGGVTVPGPVGRERIRALLSTAAARGLDVDLHVDETLDPDVATLRTVAEAALETGFPGRIVCGHCCSLSVQDEADVLRTLDLVARAGIAVVSLPMCNLYLQGRGCSTPRRRGVTLLHEMAARGIAVAVASDNTRDPFYAYGDLDMIEVFREATRILHLDHPVGEWPRAIAAGAADIVGRPDRGRIAVGLPADLILTRARTWTELNARPQSDRVVLRTGKPIDRRLPDYRDLDDLMGG